ncbi:hypothetical protein VCRA2117O328_10228 [Vibrio crassostreae]|nr:hypothetical protein VCRA2117O328_10228 [Vibrio crassostreae]
MGIFFYLKKKNRCKSTLSLGLKKIIKKKLKNILMLFLFLLFFKEFGKVRPTWAVRNLLL